MVDGEASALDLVVWAARYQLALAIQDAHKKIRDASVRLVEADADDRRRERAEAKLQAREGVAHRAARRARCAERVPGGG